MVCREHHSCGAVGAALVAAGDFHIANAVFVGGGATRSERKYAQRLAVGRHLPCYAQVLDGGICYKGEQRDVGISAVSVPIDRDGVPLSVERALVLLDRVAHYIDFLAEVYVLCQLGIDAGLSAFH